MTKETKPFIARIQINYFGRFFYYFLRLILLDWRMGGGGGKTSIGSRLKIVECALFVVTRTFISDYKKKPFYLNLYRNMSLEILKDPE